MLRKLKSLSALLAVTLMAIAVSSAMARIDRSARSNPGSGNRSAGTTHASLNSPVPTANPTFDASGRWRSNAGDEMQVFQEKDEVNAVLVNAGWAHRLAGRYVTPTTIRMVLIRRTRSGGCEVTMDLNLNVNSANSLSGSAVASETACGITQGQSYPSTWTRVL